MSEFTSINGAFHPVNVPVAHSANQPLPAGVGSDAAPQYNPLDAAQHQKLAEANERIKPLSRVAKVAAFNGWVCGFFAAVSAPFALFDVASFIMAVGLTVVAYNEFKGRTLIRKLDASAGKLLGWNQVGFLTLICVYCLWQLVLGIFSPNPLEAEIKKHPELGQLIGSPDQLMWIYDAVMIGTYALVITLTAVFQGYNAYYYFSRGKKLAAHIEQTEPWIVDLQRTMAG